MSLMTPPLKPTGSTPIFPEPLRMVSTDLAWLLESDQQMDLLMDDIQKTQPTSRSRVRKSRSMMVAKARQNKN